METIQMLSLFHRGDFDPNANLAGLRVASLVLSTLVVGVILFEAASAAAAILA
jgi:hypothetical protein